MILSPLQLDRVFFRKVHVEAEQPGTAGDDSVTMTVAPAMERHLRDRNKWKISLDLKFHPATQGSSKYSGEISLSGLFTIEDTGLSEEKQLGIIGSYGPAVLFGCARDMVLSITAQSDHGPFILPLVSFMDTQLQPATKREEKPHRRGRSLEMK